MKTTPLIMCGSMVLATLRGIKRETRRLVAPKLPASFLAAHPHYDKQDVEREVECPYGGTGDTLWVREKLLLWADNTWHYAADGAPVQLPVGHPDATAMLVWAHHQTRDYCPSIHMPRWASRIILPIERVRVQHLQDITCREAVKEGITTLPPSMFAFTGDWTFKGQVVHNRPLTRKFAHLWDVINWKRAPWASDPLVYAITFTNPYRRERFDDHESEYDRKCFG